LPFPSLDDAKGFAGWFKSLLFEKTRCEKCHRIIKKLCHAVITFTQGYREETLKHDLFLDIAERQYRVGEC
jgi:hypothetical protein